MLLGKLTRGFTNSHRVNENAEQQTDRINILTNWVKRYVDWITERN